MLYRTYHSGTNGFEITRAVIPFVDKDNFYPRDKSYNLIKKHLEKILREKWREESIDINHVIW